MRVKVIRKMPPTSSTGWILRQKNDQGEIIIVEVQLTRQLYYLQRMLYGVSKAITEHIEIGNKYDKVKKVYSTISCILILEKEMTIFIMVKRYSRVCIPAIYCR